MIGQIIIDVHVPLGSTIIDPGKIVDPRLEALEREVFRVKLPQGELVWPEYNVSAGRGLYESVYRLRALGKEEALALARHLTSLPGVPGDTYVLEITTEEHLARSGRSARGTKLEL